MDTITRTITIHMVSSLDGMIAKPDNSIEWFETTDSYEAGTIGENPEEFFKSVDCFIMGSHTYELAASLAPQYGWPYGNKPTYVLSSRNLELIKDTIHLHHGTVETLLNELPYQQIWVVGGAALTKTFLQANLTNEIRITILPIVLGEGLPFFDDIKKEIPLHLKNVTAYKNGLVELCYEIKR